jgi:hypothetical protein
MLLAVTDAGRTFLAVLGVATLVIGFGAVIALAVYVVRRAPKDGTDIGRDPRRGTPEQTAEPPEEAL